VIRERFIRLALPSNSMESQNERYLIGFMMEKAYHVRVVKLADVKMIHKYDMAKIQDLSKIGVSEEGKIQLKPISIDSILFGS